MAISVDAQRIEARLGASFLRCEGVSVRTSIGESIQSQATAIKAASP